MVSVIGMLLVVGATLLALSRSQRPAPWLLGIGLGLLSLFWVMGQFRIPWPNVHPLILVLSPYFLVTLALTFTIAGAIGVAFRLLRRWLGWFRD